MGQYKNVFITASKFGKLTKHFADFVENIISSYCENHKFLLIWIPEEDKPMLAILIVFSQMKKGIAHQHFGLNTL